MNRKKFSAGKLATAIVVGGAAMVGAQEAHAVPAFARQLGVSCAACHTVEPQLTSFGRQFKSLAYTFNSGSGNTISYEQDGAKRLAIDKIPPIAALFLSDVSWNGKNYNKVNGTANPNANFPNQMSLYYAGRVGSELGVFAQLTITQNSGFGMDNTDMRMAKETSTGIGNLVYGFDANNGPGVGDLWQSTPIWGYPFYHVANGLFNTPEAGLLSNDITQGTTAGAGGYAWLNNTWYAQVMMYRGIGDNTLNGTIANVAPYWRLAYSHEGGTNSWEVGTFGIEAKAWANGATGGPEVKYLDTGVDGQYEHVATNYSYTLHASYIHEKITLPGALNLVNTGTQVNGHIDNYQVNGQYYWHREFGVMGKYFGATGTKSAALWGANSVLLNANPGSYATTNPDSNGEILQVNYLPWINTKFGAQYIAFNKFNGNSGTTASDNNTFSLFAWFMF